MITKENIKDVINMIDKKDIKRIKNSSKEYVVLYLHVCNAFSFVSVTLTNNYTRYKNVSNNGDCILEIDDIINLIHERSK